MPVYDQTADVNFRELHRLAKLYPLPEWVKESQIADAFAPPETTPRNAYANHRDKQFPCHTKVATFISALWFYEKRSELPTKIAGWVDERLQKFAAHWGIVNTLDSLREKHAELHATHESQLPDSAFALVREQVDGSKDRRYMLRNAQEVKVAADWLHDNRDDPSLSFVNRRTIAAKILEKAAQFGAGIGDKLTFLERQAGRGIGDPEKIAELIRTRVKAASKLAPGVADGMYALAAKIAQGGPFLLDMDKMAGVCAQLEDFDRLTGIDKSYGDILPRPEDVIFAATFKEATAFANSACELLTGSVYEPEQFEKLSLSDVKGLFGDEFADQVATGVQIDGEKMATLARTLPRDSCRLLERLLNDSGMTPVVKRAAEVKQQITRELLQKAASNYRPTVVGRV